MVHVAAANTSMSGAETLTIAPGSPRENGYIESFNGRFRHELLNVECPPSLREAQVLAEAYHCRYNHHQPHRLSAYKLPAAFAAACLASAVASNLSSYEVRGGVIEVLAMWHAATGAEGRERWFGEIPDHTWSPFWHPEYGGKWFGYLNRRGERLLDSKGGRWKGRFHVPRALYLCYRKFEAMAGGMER